MGVLSNSASTYVIENSDGEFKIGKTTKLVGKRLARIRSDKSLTMNPLGDQLTLLLVVPYDFEFAMHEGLRKYCSRGEWFRCSKTFIVRRLERYARIVEQSSSERAKRFETVKQIQDHAMIRYSLRAPSEWLKRRLQAEYDSSLYGDPMLCDDVVRTEPDFSLVDKLWLRRLKDRHFRSHICSKENRDCSHYTELEDEYERVCSKEDEDEDLTSKSSRQTWTFVVENWLGKYRIGTTQRTVEARVQEMQNDNRINLGLKPLKIVALAPYDIGRKLHEDLVAHHLERIEQNRRIEDNVYSYQRNSDYPFLSGDSQNWARQGWYDVSLLMVQKAVETSVEFIETGRSVDASHGETLHGERKFLQLINWSLSKSLLRTPRNVKTAFDLERRRRLLIHQAVFQHKRRVLIDNAKYQIHSPKWQLEFEPQVESNKVTDTDVVNRIDFYRLRQVFEKMMECKKFRRRFEKYWWNTAFCNEVVDTYLQSTSEDHRSLRAASPPH